MRKGETYKGETHASTVAPEGDSHCHSHDDEDHDGKNEGYLHEVDPELETGLQEGVHVGDLVDEMALRREEEVEVVEGVLVDYILLLIVGSDGGLERLVLVVPRRGSYCWLCW